MKNNTPTPHNAAKFGQIAPRVLMAGDPKRATFVAKKFLKHKKLVSDVRGVCVWTGTYKNVPLTIMAHGMGVPSICIYAFELYNYYGVETIYRFGSAGIFNTAGLEIGDVVLATSGWSDIRASKWLGVKEDKRHTFFPSQEANENIKQTAKELNIPIHERPVVASSFFYNVLSSKQQTRMTKSSVTEMESYGLFALAKKFNKQAATVLTISDNIDNHKAMTAKERETTFGNMMKLVLESIIKQ